MLAMVCWMILHTGTPFCSATVPLQQAVQIRDSISADTAGSDVGPPYVVRQGSDLYRVALAARVVQISDAGRRVE